MKYSLITILSLLIVIAIAGCDKKSSQSPDTRTTFPKILSLTVDKDSIRVGGAEPAIITCLASGGNITYTWEVDLGDIFPLNEEGSQVRFSASECCLGEKYIKCTVSNDKGSVMDTALIYIFIP